MSIFDIFKKKNEKNLKEDVYPSIYKPVKRGHATAKSIELNSTNIGNIKHLFIAFDIETTGLSPTSDRIVEIGAVVFSDKKMLKRFSTFVNPGVPISEAASAVNHITNSTIADAPSEAEAYPKLIEFLGDALQGNVVMCAHNANFDFSFLCNTLSRLGFDANISYVDTLSLSKKYIRGLKNYKQSSLEAHFGLINMLSHRASSDAENCGHIFNRLMDLAESVFEKERLELEETKPTHQELEVCAYIQALIAEQGGDTNFLRYRKNKSGYVDISYIHNFLKMKFAKKGNYIIVKKNCSSISSSIMEPCTQSEGGTEFVRVFFSSPLDLKPFSKYIYDIYSTCYESVKDYASYSSREKQGIENSLRLMCSLSSDEVSSLLKEISEKEYAPIVVASKTEPIISRDDVVIHAVNNRVPISEIKNYDNWEKGFEKGFPYWEQGEAARKEGGLKKAIELFDLARYYGYNAPALYDSYAMVYRRLKDYSNEISILDEGILRIPEQKAPWETRRDKAIKLLFTQQKKENKTK